MERSSEVVTVKEIMTRDVVTVTRDTSVEEVAALLFNRGITGVPVVDQRGAVVGMVTEFDVISKTGQTVAEIMSTDVISVSEDTPAEQVVEILSTMRVRRVPVLREGRLVGILSRSDLVRLFSLTRWMCADCGYFVRGFQPPSRCAACGSLRIVLDREPPGM